MAVIVACRLTHHLFCLPVLPVSCRIVLICAKRSLYAAFSVLPYGESVHIRYKENTIPSREHSSFAFMFSSSSCVIHIILRKELCVCARVCACVSCGENNINVTFSEAILSWRLRDKGFPLWWLLTCFLPWKVWS